MFVCLLVSMYVNILNISDYDNNNDNNKNNNNYNNNSNSNLPTIEITVDPTALLKSIIIPYIPFY